HRLASPAEVTPLRSCMNEGARMAPSDAYEGSRRRGYAPVTSLAPRRYACRFRPAMIDVRNLSKSYRVHKRAPGIVAALRSVLKRRYETVKAVDDLSFQIAEGE